VTDLNASIRSYLDRELTMVTTEDGYELRHEDQPLATLGDPRFDAVVPCVTRDGSWHLRRLRNGDTEASDGAAVVARYDSNLLPGGTIELPDETRMRLRPPVTGETWKVRRGRRDEVLRMVRTNGPWRIEFTEAAREVYHLPLLTMFAFHAMLVEIDRPGGGGVSGDGGAAGGAGF
jgi:hypothetical protein